MESSLQPWFNSFFTFTRWATWSLYVLLYNQPLDVTSNPSKRQLSLSEFSRDPSFLLNLCQLSHLCLESDFKQFRQGELLSCTWVKPGRQIMRTICSQWFFLVLKLSCCLSQCGPTHVNYTQTFSTADSMLIHCSSLEDDDQTFITFQITVDQTFAQLLFIILSTLAKEPKISRWILELEIKSVNCISNRFLSGVL
jgi:hypothetical protein